MYSILITHYKEPERLQLLLEDIHTTLDKYRPKEIVIVDDCSGMNRQLSNIKGVYSTSDLPIRLLYTDEHKGPYYSEVKGLDNIDTEYAVVLHSDTELVGECEVKYKDCIGYLYKCCKSDERIGVVTAFGVDTNSYNIISKGNRGIGRNKSPYSIQLMYTFAGIRDAWGGLREAHSIDSGCYAIEMDVYRELGFDEFYAPYVYYMDDFCARCRTIDKYVFLTCYTCYYHAYSYKGKPAGSLALASEITPEMRNKWVDTWYNNDVWRKSATERYNIRNLSMRV